MIVDVVEVQALEMSDYTVQYRVSFIVREPPSISMGEQEITFKGKK